VVFVGYGVQAPEFNWDDYKGVDQADKYPQWKTGTEFKATRAQQLKAAGITDGMS
jgi:hypothetical protein